jgi:dihydropteroate synthase
LSADEEWQRIGPVLKQVVKWDIPVSVDTYHPQTMQKALDLGVDIVNDVWAFRQKGALEAVASSRCGLCMMHMHGEPATMQLRPMVGNVMDELSVFFQTQLALIDEARIDQSRVVLDPGFGFGKTLEHNLALMRELPQLATLRPLLIGVSRKSMIAKVLHSDAMDDRYWPTIALTAHACEHGARIVRVHDVKPNREALRMMEAILGAV